MKQFQHFAKLPYSFYALHDFSMHFVICLLIKYFLYDCNSNNNNNNNNNGPPRSTAPQLAIAKQHSADLRGRQTRPTPWTCACVEGKGMLMQVQNIWKMFMNMFRI